MREFFIQEQVLLRILKKKLNPALYEYAVRELEKFYDKCYREFDIRAVHTDREGQPKLIKYNKFGEEVSEIWVNEGYKKTVADTYNTGIVGYVHKEIPELGQKGNYLYSYAQELRKFLLIIFTVITGWIRKCYRTSIFMRLFVR